MHSLSIHCSDEKKITHYITHLVKAFFSQPEKPLTALFFPSCHHMLTYSMNIVFK